MFCCHCIQSSGCIIRSKFLGNIKQAFDTNPKLDNLLLDEFFTNEIHKCQNSWRQVVSTGVQLGVPLPCFSTALAFYDGYRSKTLPANLIQVGLILFFIKLYANTSVFTHHFRQKAQRDYFGAHTYELLANPGTFVHTNWTGRGGNVSSSAYNA